MTERKYTDLFLDLTRDIASVAGHSLTDTELHKLAARLDAKATLNWDSRHSIAPSRERVEPHVLAILEAKSAATEGAERGGQHANTCGVPPELWAKLSPIERLTRARAWEAQKHAGQPKKKATDSAAAQRRALQLKTTSPLESVRVAARQELARLDREGGK